MVLTPDPSSPDERARKLGISFGEPDEHPQSIRNKDITVVRDLAFISGTGPLSGGSVVKGRLGEDLDVDAGYRAAESAAMRMLEKIKYFFGELSAVERWLKVTGYVSCSDAFEDQPAVLNGFSDLVASVYGDERGVCARAAIGVNTLPLGIPVEVEAIVLIANAT